jgi:signal transduction histidine kinase
MDQIWVAFDGGILRMRPRDGSRVQQYGPSDGLIDSTINAIHSDRRGDLWIGGNRGLSRLHGNRFETLTDHNGLPPRAVTSVIDDDSGNLWLTYRYFGFVRVARDEIDRAISDPAHRVRYESYSMSDGIAGAPDLLNGDIAAKSADGRLWFVTGRGLTIFDPAEHRTEIDSEPSVPRIEGVTADDHRYRTAVGTALPPRTGRLRIDYTVVNLASLDKISFRYRLDGFDKDWVDGTMPRQAYYTNLPPGQYRFRLQAAHDTQTWTDAESDWSFQIEPMFYETRWFYALSVVAVGLLAVGVWRVRIRQVRKQLALVYNERIRLSRDIHDTLLQSLYGVALQLDAAPRDPHPSPLRMHLQRIRRQIDDHISEARQAIWDLRSPALNRQDLVGALRDSGDVLTAGKVAFNLKVTGTPRRYAAKLETHVLRIAHEAIMNAVRHAGARHVELELGFSDQGLSLRVTDDGRGFDITQYSTLHLSHYGLVNMKERAADVGGRCIIESKPGAGSSVIAEFPLAPVA